MATGWGLGLGEQPTEIVRSGSFIRMLSRDGRTTPLGEAIAHYGRIPKSLHILRLADEPGYRRQIKTQANLQEGRPALGRKIFHGRAGQLYQRYADGMEDQLGTLGLGRVSFQLPGALRPLRGPDADDE